MRAQPALYNQLKDKKTKLGVNLGHCIKTGVDNKGKYRYFGRSSASQIEFKVTQWLKLLEWSVWREFLSFCPRRPRWFPCHAHMPPTPSICELECRWSATPKWTYRKVHHHHRCRLGVRSRFPSPVLPFEETRSEGNVNGLMKLEGTSPEIFPLVVRHHSKPGN